VKDEIDQVFAPAIELLQQSVLNAESGFVPIDDKDKFNRWLATQLKLTPGLAWFSYGDERTGRYYAARRESKDQSIVIHTSDPKDNDGRAIEFRVGANEELTRLDTSHLPGDFDPRKREWYQTAGASTGVVLSDPYAFFEGPLGLTASQALRKKGELKGVFTADLYLSDVGAALETLSTRLGGVVAITGRDAKRLMLPRTATDESARPLVATLQNSIGGLDKLPVGEVRVAEADVNGVKWLVVCEIHRATGGKEWALIAGAPRERFADPSLRYVRAAMYGCGVLFALALVFAVVWSLRLVRRLNETESALQTIEVKGMEHAGLKETTLSPDIEGIPPPSAGIKGTTKIEKFELPAKLHREIEDLSSDVLLAPLTQLRIGDRAYPSLAGIPLLAKLGQGGMGAVYFGYHPRLKKEVAVKVLSYLSSGGQSQDTIDRFHREASLAARIATPHLVQVFDANQENGVFFLVMEYVYGVPASDCAGFLYGSDNTPVPESVALQIAIGAATGLAAAHREGIVHRDIKPENILIPKRPDGTLNYSAAKLLDLGIAREEKTDGLTGTRMALGTVGFMAPEQARDARSVGKGADVFAMGATLYAILSGRPPFSGNSAFEILMATVSKPHKPLQEIRRDVSPMTIEVIDNCLKKNALERFQDAVKLQVALEQCLRHVGTDAGTIRLRK